MVVFVVRKDLWKKRAKANLDFMDSVFGKNKVKSSWSKREKVARNYYGKIIPFAYFDFFGLIGWLKYIMIVIFKITSQEGHVTTKCVQVTFQKQHRSNNLCILVSLNTPPYHRILGTDASN